MIKVNEISLIFTGGHQQLEVCLTLMAHREHLAVFLRAVFWCESVSQNPPPPRGNPGYATAARNPTTLCYVNFDGCQSMPAYQVLDVCVQIIVVCAAAFGDSVRIAWSTAPTFAEHLKVRLLFVWTTTPKELHFCAISALSFLASSRSKSGSIGLNTRGVLFSSCSRRELRFCWL